MSRALTPSRPVGIDRRGHGLGAAGRQLERLGQRAHVGFRQLSHGTFAGSARIAQSTGRRRCHSVACS